MNIMFVRAASAWTPAKLFAGGEQGAWYDPSDFSTMWQDTAGTTPVTATGQSVARIDDKSGRGNNATQGTASKRPVLRQDGSGYYYLEFDGTDDAMVTGSINPGSVDKAQSFVGMRHAADVTYMVFEFSANLSGNAGSVHQTAGSVFGALGAGNGYVGASRGSAIATGNHGGQIAQSAPFTAVVTTTHDIAGDSSVVRLNGTAGTTGTADKGTGNFGTYALFIGARDQTSFYLNGRIYSLILRFSSANLDAATIASAETWVNGKTGAY